MKSAHGFVTEDGRFFEDAIEAEYHEARCVLYKILDDVEVSTDRYVDPEKFIEILTLVYPVVDRWINAFRKDVDKAQKYEEDCARERARLEQVLFDTPSDVVQGNGEAVNSGRPYRGSRENPPGVQQFTPRGHEPVPDMGRRAQPEELQDEC